MILAINYANQKYRRSQRFNSQTAVDKGKADKVIEYTPQDIDVLFREKNKDILRNKRGNGYWLWKPYIIKKTLEKMQYNDYLCYLDSGAYYINRISYLIKQMEKDGQDIMSFELPFLEKKYTKRDIFVYMRCDSEVYTNTNQRMATMILLKKTDKVVSFVDEWLDYGEKEGIITDQPNHLGKANYKEFIENRHDQSIFSLLCKKYGVIAYRDPSQYGRYADLFWNRKLDKMEYIKSSYPQIIVEHRRVKVTKKLFWQQLFFAYAPYVFVSLYYRNIYIKGENNKIAILTDNMPISEDKYGYGMYKVVNRLLLALNSQIDTVICTDQVYDEEKVDEKFKAKMCVINQFHAFSKFYIEDFLFFIQMLKVIYQLKQKKIKNIFIPLGADYHELKKAYILAHYFKMKVSIYVVDDFQSYYRDILKQRQRDEGRTLNRRIARYFKEMHAVFAISEGMQDYILSTTGKRSRLLSLPYEYQPLDIKNIQDKTQIMFIGNINQLYIQGLKDIAEIIDYINMHEQREIKLRFTYKSALEVKKIIGSYQCIVSQRLESEEILRKEMRSSLFCFMPYSENGQFEIMQNTSFPSKLIEYLSAAKSVVIYGNSSNTAMRYFEKYNLSYVVYGRDKHRLHDIIIEHLTKRIDFNKDYRTVLKKKHSFKMTKEKIMQFMS